ncbi:hypothetical protein OEZ85_000853 [Tetradesmus obliquus]|uniref:Uncharacterized protein n=1 Tax=Tetradesmus obliquus TaxID=3088 RepID=A0ABY8UJH3_TETOB|nr:hypothetical protein OEZ85_000853 [Tetradesmus obliquus]
MAKQMIVESGLMGSLEVGMKWTAAELQHIKQQQQQQQQGEDWLLYMRGVGLSMLGAAAAAAGGAGGDCQLACYQLLLHPRLI